MQNNDPPKALLNDVIDFEQSFLLANLLRFLWIPMSLASTIHARATKLRTMNRLRDLLGTIAKDSLLRFGMEGCGTSKQIIHACLHCTDSCYNGSEIGSIYRLVLILQYFSSYN